LACASDDLNNPTAIMPFMPGVSPFTDPPYSAATDGTTKAKMCIAEQGWTLVSGEVQYWDRLIDEGDGVTRGP
jgi:hypothetical protein